MELGRVLCDMHYGFSVRGFISVSSIQIDCPNSVGVLSTLCENIGIDTPHNKIAVLVSENIDGTYTAAYSYDGNRFGMIKFKSIK